MHRALSRSTHAIIGEVIVVGQRVASWLSKVVCLIVGVSACLVSAKVMIFCLLAEVVLLVGDASFVLRSSLCFRRSSFGLGRWSSRPVFELCAPIVYVLVDSFPSLISPVETVRPFIGRRSPYLLGLCRHLLSLRCLLLSLCCLDLFSYRTIHSDFTSFR